MFEPLKDRALFAKVAIHPELETVTWPNGADLAPEFLSFLSSKKWLAVIRHTGVRAD